MPKFAGYNAKLYHATNGSTFTELGCMQDVTLDDSTTALETTCNSNGGNSSFIGGLSNWTVSGTFLYDTSTTTIATLQTLKAAKTVMDLELIPLTGTGNAKANGQAFITALGQSFAVDGVATVTAEFQGTGALTYSTQS